MSASQLLATRLHFHHQASVLDGYSGLMPQRRQDLNVLPRESLAARSRPDKQDPVEDAARHQWYPELGPRQPQRLNLIGLEKRISQGLLHMLMGGRARPVREEPDQCSAAGERAMSEQRGRCHPM